MELGDVGPDGGGALYVGAGEEGGLRVGGKVSHGGRDQIVQHL